ncbi:hypothetical protein DICVIV_12657, partial [Dictyocaulus viviparus]
NPGGFQPQSNHGGFQQPGGYHPQPNQGGFHPQGGYQPHGGFHPNQGGFRSGTGIGSSSSSGTFKKALLGGALGAVGGLVAFEAGKAIIQSATKPFNYGGHDYYWDNHYQPKNNEIVCSIPLSQLQQLTSTTTTTTTNSPGSPLESTTISSASQPDQILNNLQFVDGTRPKQLTWGCRKGVEVCCGTDCCPAPANNMGNTYAGSGGAQNMAGVAFGIILLLLLSCCCCGFVAYKCCRSSIENFLPQNSNKQSVPPTGDYSQQYPLQQYPTQTYPPNQGYPMNVGYPQSGYAQPNYPQSYPHPAY